MNLSQFIPAGRTGLVKKGKNAYQIQTEYNYRPYPRLTTTISTEGRVLHKVEKKLDKPIESFEEQAVVEQALVRQHAEVSKIIRNNNGNKQISGEALNSKEKTVDQSVYSSQPQIVTPDEPLVANAPDLPLHEQFRKLPGVRHVFELDEEGNFVSKQSSDIFKNEYGFIFKNIRELLEIFRTVPGVTLSREKGVYEVERNGLYMVSVGDCFYFVTVEYPARDFNYERTIKDLVLKASLAQ